jgi:hypothetical protein
MEKDAFPNKRGRLFGLSVLFAKKEEKKGGQIC